jgi:hypothetical protein
MSSTSKSIVLAALAASPVAATAATYTPSMNVYWVSLLALELEYQVSVRLTVFSYRVKAETLLRD